MKEMRLGISLPNQLRRLMWTETQNCHCQVNFTEHRPPCIPRTTSCICITAAQAWTFATILPLLIGDLIPNGHSPWECFLLLLEITKHVTARLTSSSVACYVAALVHQHHQDFKECYPSVSLTPKFHYMVHFASQMTRYVCICGINRDQLPLRHAPINTYVWCIPVISVHTNCVCIPTFSCCTSLRMGPLQTSWCMRMEAKNNYFKKAGRIENFKNVLYSVAKRHQKLLTAFLQGKFFTYNELECGPCKWLRIQCTHTSSVLLLSTVF